MIVYKTETQPIKLQTDVLCDKCGRSCMGQYGNFCGIQFTISGGPDSPIFPDDEQSHTYQVCEHCADEWMITWSKDYFTYQAGPSIGRPEDMVEMKAEIENLQEKSIDTLRQVRAGNYDKPIPR